MARMTRHVTRSVLSVIAAGLALSACGSTTTVRSTPANTSGVTTPATATSTSTGTGTGTGTADATSPTTSAPSSSSAAATPTVQAATQQMKAGFAKAKSAHLVAKEVGGSATIKIDLAGTVDGSNQRGTISNSSNSSSSDGGTVQFVIAGGKQYINGNIAYWMSTKSGKGMTYVDKWIILPASSKGFSSLTLKSLFDELESKFTDAKTANMKLTTVSENGEPAWQIADSATTGVIAADGSGRLLRAEHTEAGRTEKYVFDKWNAVPTVTAPAGAVQG